MRDRIAACLQGGFPTENAGQVFAYLLERQDADQSAKRELLGQGADVVTSAIYCAAFEEWLRFAKTSGWAIAEAPLVHRMFIGLGESSVLETHVTLHGTYGVPFIPGTSLKGLASEYAEALIDGGAEFLTKSQRDWLFGTTDAAGNLDFQDAWWIPSGKALCLEVDTPHHMRYHATRGEVAASDFDDPNPVAHLAIQGTFLLALAGESMAAHLALSILVRGLEQWGIGGRVNADYGRFSVARIVTHPTTEG